MINTKEKVDGRARFWIKNPEKTIIFRIFYLGNCGCGFSRKVELVVEMNENQNLDELHEAIIYKAFKWDDPHMYSFFMDNRPFSRDRDKEYNCEPESDWDSDKKPHSTKTLLKSLNLKKKQKFLFIFDFGDEHHFGIKVEDFGIFDRNKKYPVILEKIGKAPEQYAEEEDG